MAEEMKRLRYNKEPPGNANLPSQCHGRNKSLELAPYFDQCVNVLCKGEHAEKHLAGRQRTT
jgi:hypothetical protein